MDIAGVQSCGATLADVVALVAAISTLTVAIAGMIYQLRQMRADIVASVERHMAGIVASNAEMNRQ